MAANDEHIVKRLKQDIVLDDSIKQIIAQLQDVDCTPSLPSKEEHNHRVESILEGLRPGNV